MARDEVSLSAGSPLSGGSAAPIEGLLAERTWLQGLARRMVADAHLADDLAQETWIAGLRAPLRVLQTPAKLRAYLAGCLRNRLLEHRRKESRRTLREERGARNEALPSTAEVVAEASMQTELAEHLMALDEPLREAVLWRYHRGVSISKAARHLGVPRSTLQGRLDRALAELRKRMDTTHGSRDAWCAALAPWIGWSAEQVTVAGSGLALQLGGSLAVVAAIGVLGWMGLGGGEPPAVGAPRADLALGTMQGPAERGALAALPTSADRSPMRESGADLARLTLEVVVDEPERWEATLTDAEGKRQRQRRRPDGVFEFGDLAPGPAHVTLRAEGRRPRTHELDLGVGPTRASVEIEDARRVRVHLRDPLGEAWSAKRLQAELGSGEVRVVVTDSPEWSAASAPWLSRSSRSVSRRGSARTDSGDAELFRLGLDVEHAVYAHLLLAETWICGLEVPATQRELTFEVSSEFVRDHLVSGLAMRVVDPESIPVERPVLTLVGGRGVRRFHGDDEGRIVVEAPPGRYHARLEDARGEVSIGALQLDPGVITRAGDVVFEAQGGLEVRLRGPRRARGVVHIELRHVAGGDAPSVLRTGPWQSFDAGSEGATHVDTGAGRFAVRAVSRSLGWKSAWREVEVAAGGLTELELELEPVSRQLVLAEEHAGRCAGVRVVRGDAGELALVRTLDDGAAVRFELPVGDVSRRAARRRGPGAGGAVDRVVRRGGRDRLPGGILNHRDSGRAKAPDGLEISCLERNCTNQRPTRAECTPRKGCRRILCRQRVSTPGPFSLLAQAHVGALDSFLHLGSQGPEVSVPDLVDRGRLGGLAVLDVGRRRDRGVSGSCVPGIQRRQRVRLPSGRDPAARRCPDGRGGRTR